MAEQDSTQPDAEHAELASVARLLIDSWNRSDAQGFARLFTVEAEYVAGSGKRSRGRQAISNLLAKPAPGTQVCLIGEPVVRCGTGSGELTFTWSATEGDRVARRGSITCACTRHGSGWLIDALHNDEDSQRSAQLGVDSSPWDP